MLFALIVLMCSSPRAAAQDGVIVNDWPYERGPAHNGVGAVTGLPNRFADYEQIWQVPFRGVSAPVLFGGRLHIQGLTPAQSRPGERIAVFDAQTGKLLWDHVTPIYNTRTPTILAAGSTPAVDPETGNTITQGVSGLVQCFGPDGELLWDLNFTETFGARIDYRGRMAGVVIDADLVVLSFTTIGWGADNQPRQRTFALDKKTGEVRWTSAPGGPAPSDTAGTALPVTIGGRRLLIIPNADGGVYALNAGTGAVEWSFGLSSSGAAAVPVAFGDRILVVHPAANGKGAVLVCINGRGTGDITDSGRLWRVKTANPCVSAPLLNGADLFLLDQAGELHMYDARNGRLWWKRDLGARSNTAPVLADGKLFATESRGRVFMLSAKRDRARPLDEMRLTPTPGRDAMLRCAPIPAYGRLYLVTDQEIRCLAAAQSPFEVGSSPFVASLPAEDSEPASLQVIPAVADLEPGIEYHFRAAVFDAAGRHIRTVTPQWRLDDLQGKITYLGEFVPDNLTDTGAVTAEWNGLEGSAGVRIFAEPPRVETFENIAPMQAPASWVGAAGPGSSRGAFLVIQAGAEAVLEKPVAPSRDQSGTLYLGASNASGYSLQADVMGFVRKRFLPDIGLYSHGYRLDLLGPGRQIVLHTAGAGGSLNVARPFDWRADTWYTLKLSVVYAGGSASIRGKVWRAGDEEPKAWTISAEDPQPILRGAPGLYGYSRAKIHYDNIRITP